ncbi:hypothetical protein RYX36_015284 [Vicia faba]
MLMPMCTQLGVPHSWTPTQCNLNAPSKTILKAKTTNSMPPEKKEIFKSLESWVSERVLPLAKPVEECWQPHDFLPNSALPSDEFIDQVKDLRVRTAGLPDEYLAVLMRLVQATIHGLYGHALGQLRRIDMEICSKHIFIYLDIGTENNPYMGFVYTSFQERATFVSDGCLARLAKKRGDPILSCICGTIAADEKRHEIAYERIVEKLLEVDPTETMIAISKILSGHITMPGHLMHDG